MANTNSNTNINNDATTNNNNTAAARGLSPDPTPLQTQIQIGSIFVPTRTPMPLRRSLSPRAETSGVPAVTAIATTEEAVHVAPSTQESSPQTGNTVPTPTIVNSEVVEVSTRVENSEVEDVDRVSSVISNIVGELNEEVVVDPFAGLPVIEKLGDELVGGSSVDPIVDETQEGSVESIVNSDAVAEEFVNNVFSDDGGVPNAVGSISEEDEEMPMIEIRSESVNEGAEVPTVPNTQVDSQGVDLLAAAAALSSVLPAVEDTEEVEEIPLQTRQTKKGSSGSKRKSGKKLRKKSAPTELLEHQKVGEPSLVQEASDEQAEEEVQVISSTTGSKKKMTRAAVAEMRRKIDAADAGTSGEPTVSEEPLEPEVDLEELEKAAKKRKADKKAAKKKKKVKTPSKAAEKEAEASTPSKSTRSKTQKRRAETQGESSKKKKQKTAKSPATPSVYPPVDEYDEDTESDTGAGNFELRRRSPEKGKSVEKVQSTLRVKSSGRKSRAKVSEEKTENTLSKNIIAEKHLAEQTRRIPAYVTILEESGMLNIMRKAGRHWPTLVRDFINALHEDIDEPAKPGYHMVTLRGLEFEFSPAVLNSHLNREASEDTGSTLLLDDIVGELTGNTVKVWPSGTQLPSSSLTVRYAVMFKAALTCLVPASNTTNVSHTMGRALYVLGTGGNLNVGQVMFDLTVAHASTQSHLKPICFPGIICEVLRTQHPEVVEENDGFGILPKPLIITDQLLKGKRSVDIPAPSVVTGEPRLEPKDATSAVLIGVYEEAVRNLKKEIREREAQVEAYQVKIRELQTPVVPAVVPGEVAGTSSGVPAADLIVGLLEYHTEEIPDPAADPAAVTTQTTNVEDPPVEGTEG